MKREKKTTYTQCQLNRWAPRGLELAAGKGVVVDHPLEPVQ